MANRIIDWIGPRGLVWSYWVANRKLIGDFIRSNELKPITIEAVSTKATRVRAAGPLIDLGIRGGIRFSHLHFNNRIYMLNDAQWNKFSKGIIADCKAKLAKVGQISFEDGMVLGEITQTLAIK